jgi:hypothetical protein
MFLMAGVYVDPIFPVVRKRNRQASLDWAQRCGGATMSSAQRSTMRMPVGTNVGGA